MLPEKQNFEAGCVDRTAGLCDGCVAIDFDREATSLAAAVGSAILDLEKAGDSAWLESVETSHGVTEASENVAAVAY